MATDGITKELELYFESLSKLGDLAVDALKEQIDIETERTEIAILNATPENSGGLKNSLKKTKLNKRDKYGYELVYAGENKDGVPYEKIANILNYGTSTIKPKKFITKAIKELKDLDQRAAIRFDQKTKDKDV